MLGRGRSPPVSGHDADVFIWSADDPERTPFGSNCWPLPTRAAYNEGGHSVRALPRQQPEIPQQSRFPIARIECHFPRKAGCHLWIWRADKGTSDEQLAYGPFDAQVARSVSLTARNAAHSRDSIALGRELAATIADGLIGPFVAGPGPMAAARAGLSIRVHGASLSPSADEVNRTVGRFSTGPNAV